MAQQNWNRKASTPNLRSASMLMSQPICACVQSVIIVSTDTLICVNVLGQLAVTLTVILTLNKSSEGAGSGTVPNSSYLDS